MNQEPEQQPQGPAAQSSAELPPVPVVMDAPPQNSEPTEVQKAQTTPTEPAGVPGSGVPSELIGRPQSPQEGLAWQASEYVEHEKSMKWFVVLMLVALLLAALAVFLLKNYTFAILIVVMAIAVAVWAKRPAAEMNYQLNAAGVSVNGKLFAIHDFRAFGVLQDGGIYAVTLLPIKRFSPGVTIYFPHELGEQIVDTLGAVLPMEDMQPDWIDKLTRKLNF